MLVLGRLPTAQALGKYRNAMTMYREPERMDRLFFLPRTKFEGTIVLGEKGQRQAEQLLVPPFRTKPHPP